MVIKLFYTPHTCSLASHIALQDAAAEYATVRINFADDEQRKPAYLAVNPKGRVPALVTDRGVLTETPAMLAFIAQSFPQARLAPLDDPFRLRGGAGLQQLFVRDAACGAFAPHARNPLGRRSGCDNGDAAQGPGIRERLLRADRATTCCEGPG